MTASKPKMGLLDKRHLVGGAMALGGMVIGAIVGIAVQVGVESTGLLGPSVEALLAEQESNFDEIGTQIQTLRRMSADPEIAAGLSQLADLLTHQDELQSKAAQELTLLNRQVADLRQQALDQRGFAGGADLWLGNGESVSIGDERHVLGVVRTWTIVVDVNLNGQKSRLNVGDALTVAADKGDCTVFFKQGLRKEDNRVGFDVSCG